MSPESDDGKTRDQDLDQLEAFSDEGLVEAIRHLAAQCRQDKVRQNEDGPGDRDQRVRVRSRQLEQDEKNQRILEKIVVEGAEELAPEQRRETSGGHQGRQHGAPGRMVGNLVIEGGSRPFHSLARELTGSSALCR